MEIFDIRKNDFFENSKSENPTAKTDKNSNFSTLLNSSVSQNFSEVSKQPFFMNFLSQKLDANVIVQKFSKNNDVEKTVVEPKAKPKNDTKPKEKTPVRENNRTEDRRDDTKNEQVSKNTEQEKQPVKEKNNDVTNNETPQKENNLKDNKNDTVTNETTAETVAVDNTVQNVESTPFIAEVMELSANLEEATITIKPVEDGTKVNSDLLEEAAPSSKGDTVEKVVAPLSTEDGTSQNNNNTSNKEETNIIKLQNVSERTETKPTVSNISDKPVLSTETNKVSDKNLGVELASMTEESITDKQASELSKTIGEGIKANIKVEVKDNTPKNVVKAETMMQTVAAEELSAKNSADKTQESNIRSASFTSTNLKGINSTEQATNSNGGENPSNMANTQQNNVVELNLSAANEGGKTASATFADTLKAVSNNITEGSNKQTQANDNIGGVTGLKNEKTENNNLVNNTKTNPNVKQNPSVVTEQIKVSINKAALKNADNINVQLRPKELGRIDIKMEINSEGKLSATISASRPETLDILQRDIKNLEKSFTDAGFKTDSGSLSFNLKGGNPNSHHNNNGNLGNMPSFKAENSSENILTANVSNYSLSGNGRGVNIKV